MYVCMYVCMYVTMVQKNNLPQGWESHLLSTKAPATEKTKTKTKTKTNS